MINFDSIKSWYDAGLWSEKRVADAVKKEIITAAQYKKITGNKYVA